MKVTLIKSKLGLTKFIWMPPRKNSKSIFRKLSQNSLVSIIERLALISRGERD